MGICIIDILNHRITESYDANSPKFYHTVKYYMKKIVPRSSPLRKEMIAKIIQTDEVVRLLDEIIYDASPDDYWCKLAEKKRFELEEALAENERLFKIKSSLLQQNSYYKMMLAEANSFITVFKDVADEAADDTGIDLEDENNCSE